MREILFRGRLTDKSRWVYGCLLNNIYGAVPAIMTDQSVDDAFNLEFEYDHVEEKTVGQFTGLTDRNGKKIFEGDIVMGAYKGKGVVEFTTEDVASCGCCFPYFVGSGFKADDVNLGDCEVIGNIHDNPELLEKK